MRDSPENALRTVLANSLLFASCLPEAIKWRLATWRPAKAQARVLMRIVRRNAATAFGRDHGFSAIRTTGDYQQRVAAGSYSEFEPYIQRAAAGEPRVLTVDAVERFALSSGSAAASKLVPYTASLLREFRRGIGPLLAGLFLEYPGLLFGKSYWQVSPIGAPAGLTAGGIRIGFGEDSEYFGGFRGALVRAALAVPERVAGIERIDEFRFETLRYLLADRNLRFISVWNPSFLWLLVGDVGSLAPRLIERIGSGGAEARASELRRIFADWDGMGLTGTGGGGRTLLEAVWPKLRVVSCWADAGAREAAERLRPPFPHVEIQPKGLIATEGIATFPWRGAGNALALRSHFFEFFEGEPGPAAARPKLAQELETGRRYSIVLTTSGGLYRYRMGDLVEVTGWLGGCPLLGFRGKEDGVVDLAGEKLNAAHVRRAAAEVFARYGFHPRFWMLAPERGEPPGYALYVQSDSGAPEGLISAVEAALEENFHYGYARRVGQLAPLRLFAIDPGSEPEAQYLRARAREGQRLGGIKRSELDRNDGWSEVFVEVKPGARGS